MLSILKKLVSSISCPRRVHQTFNYRPTLESLEDRRLMSASSPLITSMGTLYWVASDGNIWEEGEGGTHPLTSGVAPGVITEIRVGTSQAGVFGQGEFLYALAGGNVYESINNGQGFQQLVTGGSYTQIAADAGKVFALSSFGGLDEIQWNGGSSINLRPVYDGSAGPITDIDSSGNGQLVHAVYFGNVFVHGFSNGNWFQEAGGGNAASLSAWQGEDVVFVLTTAGGVERIQGQVYLLYDGGLGPVSSLAAGSEVGGTPAVYVLGGGAVFENFLFDESGWHQLTGSGLVTQLSADATSRFYVVNLASQLWSNATLLDTYWFQYGYPYPGIGVEA